MWLLCVLIKVFVPTGASAQLQDSPRKETLVPLLRGLTIHGCPSASAQPLPEQRNRPARSWHTTLQLIKPSKNNPTWLRGVLISVFTCCVLINSVWSSRGIECRTVYTGFSASLLKSHFNQPWTQQISQPALFLFALDTDSTWNQVSTIHTTWGKFRLKPS